METIEKIWNILVEDLGPEKTASLIGKIEQVLSESESMENKAKPKPASDQKGEGFSNQPKKSESKSGGAGSVPEGSPLGPYCPTGDSKNSYS